jgi:ABC-2 type transport system permease protein
VFLSSHLLSEVEALCTRIGVLDRGRLVCRTPSRRSRSRPGLVEVTTPDLHRAATLLGARRQRVDGRRCSCAPQTPASLNASSSRPASASPRSASSGGPWSRRCSTPPAPARTGSRRDRRRAAQAAAPAADLGLDRLLRRASHDRRGASCRERGRAAARHRTGFLSAVLENGALYPAAALAIVLPLFLPWPVAVVAGDAVAGEAQAGTLRYLLVRPWAGRSCWWPSSSASSSTRCWPVVVVAVVAYVVGTNLFGSGPLPSTSGTELSTAAGTLRTVLAVLYVGWSMLGVAAVALFLSTVTDSPLAGRARRDRAARQPPGVLVGWRRRPSVQPYLPTRYWLAFVDFFRDPVLYRDVVRGTGPAGVLHRRLPDRGLGEPDDQGRHELGSAAWCW